MAIPNEIIPTRGIKKSSFLKGCKPNFQYTNKKRKALWAMEAIMVAAAAPLMPNLGKRKRLESVLATTRTIMATMLYL